MLPHSYYITVYITTGFVYITTGFVYITTGFVYIITGFVFNILIIESMLIFRICKYCI